VTQVPSHADQIVFLTRVQKILDEGQFVATYKFALLIALIDVAIERGDDSGAPLDVELAWLAEKFIELYWNHCKPYGGAVRSQNKGSNIAVLGRIHALQTKTISLAEARRAPQWGATLRGIGQIIQAMPLFRLQMRIAASCVNRPKDTPPESDGLLEFSNCPVAALPAASDFRALFILIRRGWVSPSDRAFGCREVLW
jgi:hypothetical protein